MWAVNWCFAWLAFFIEKLNFNRNAFVRMKLKWLFSFSVMSAKVIEQCGSTVTPLVAVLTNEQTCPEILRSCISLSHEHSLQNTKRTNNVETSTNKNWYMFRERVKSFCREINESMKVLLWIKNLKSCSPTVVNVKGRISSGIKGLLVLLKASAVFIPVESPCVQFPYNSISIFSRTWLTRHYCYHWWTLSWSVLWLVIVQCILLSLFWLGVLKWDMETPRRQQETSY